MAEGGAVAEHRRNALLNALPADELAALMPELEVVDLVKDVSIFENGRPATHVWFPHSGMISIVAIGEDGTGVEVAVIGRESMSGLALALSSDAMESTAMVQVAGMASRMPAARFTAALDEHPGFRRLILRSVLAVLTQVARNVACAHLHSLEMRCAKWLLLSHDYAGSDEFRLTQDYLAMMLGVTRPSVSETASRLRSTGMIDYSRGNLRIIDRAGLEKASCECYGILKAEFARLLT